MNEPNIKDYARELKEINVKLDVLVDDMDFFKDISVYAKTKTNGEVNWIGKLARMKGMLLNILEDSEEIVEELEE